MARRTRGREKAPETFMSAMKDDVLATIRRKVDSDEEVLAVVQGQISTSNWMAWIPVLDKFHTLFKTSAWFYVLTDRGLVRMPLLTDAKTILSVQRVPLERLGRASVKSGMLFSKLTLETRGATFVVDDIEASWAQTFADAWNTLRHRGPAEAPPSRPAHADAPAAPRRPAPGRRPAKARARRR